MRKIFILPGLALISLLTMAAAAGVPEGRAPELRAWNVDVPHTEINFSVKHFFTPVSGTFRVPRLMGYTSTALASNEGVPFF